MQRGEKLTGRSVSGIIVCAGLFVVLVGLMLAMQLGWRASAAVGHSDDYWKETGETALQRAGADKAVPAQARVWQLNEDALRLALKSDRETGGRGDGEMEGQRDGGREGRGVVVSLPMPDGRLARFRVVEAPVMRAELAAQYPEIKTYRGWNVENPALTMRCDLTPLGFHAAMTDGAELMTIHPVSQNDKAHYVSYAAKDYQAAAREALCLVNDSKVIHRILPSHSIHSSVGTNFRDYDIAIATTGEYAVAYGGGTLSGTRASVVAWLMPLTLIYERELSIRFNLVANNDQVLYTNASTDPFTNGDVGVMVDQVRGALRDKIGEGNYDLGLVLGTPVGTPASYGNAYVGVVCETASDSFGPYKGGGAVLVSGSQGNTASVTLMAHEIGHQFGATHTQNANCGSRVGDTAYESGSGVTLMSNAGGCGSDNIAGARSMNFHSGSFEQIIGYLNVLGGTCATAIPSNNNVPTVNGGPDYVIPILTPFTLTATGNDADGDPLSYLWEQVDAGGSGYQNPPYADQAGDPQNTTRPLFRPFPLPSPTPVVPLLSRTFPSLTYILNSQNTPPVLDGNGFQTAENLPGVARTMNFRVTVRDGHGGVSNDSVRLDVDSTAGPFLVTSQTSGVTWTSGQQQIVTWSVAGTNNTNGVNCQNVNIRLSIDGGNTFPNTSPYILATNTPNDGSEAIVVPSGITSSMARIKVEAVNNLFFDISDVNFNIQQPVCNYAISLTGQGFTTSSGAGTVQVTVAAGCSWTATSNAAWITITGGASGSGNGTVSYSVTANSGTTRRGTVTIAGQTFTVTQAGTASGNGLMFYPLDRPVRLLDTRAGQGNCDNVSAPITGGTSLTTLGRGTCEGIVIPAIAQAITGNVTVINQTAQSGYMTVYPDGQAAPVATNMIFGPNGILANNFTVGLSAAGNFNIFGERTIDVIVDISGYYAPPGASGLYFHTLSKPVRLLDTRAGQGNCDSVSTPIPAGTSLTTLARVTCEGLTIPSAAQAIAGNATVINGSGQTGYLTLYPNGVAAPLAANMIYFPGQLLSNAFTTSLSANGEFNIFGERTIDMVIDVAGYYSNEATDVNGAGLLFTPLSRPVRILDTRAGEGNCDSVGTPITGGSSIATAGRLTCEGIMIPNSAQTLLGNVTVINQTGQLGYLTLYPDGVPQPLVANMIYEPGQILSNAFVVGLNSGTGQFRIFAERTLEAIVDISGYFAP